MTIGSHPTEPLADKTGNAIAQGAVPLAVRNLMHDLRSAGEVTSGPRPFTPRDRSAFLSALDQAIRRLQRLRR